MNNVSSSGCFYPALKKQTKLYLCGRTTAATNCLKNDMSIGYNNWLVCCGKMSTFNTMLKHFNISAVRICPIYYNYSRVTRSYSEVRNELFKKLKKYIRINIAGGSCPWFSVRSLPFKGKWAGM
jgi:hypothetical protein